MVAKVIIVAKISEITRNTKKGYKFDTAHAKTSVNLLLFPQLQLT